MRLPVAALLLATLGWDVSAQDGSVGALVAAARTAIRAGRPDHDIARIIGDAQLTERLEDAAVEELQSEGAGPEALVALDRQRGLSRHLANPAPPLKLFDAPPQPSAEEQSKILNTTREMALNYTASLPNFICTETVRRYEDPKGLQAWKALDTLTLAVAYSEKGERYKLLTVNGRPTGKTPNSVGGFKSSGEFGSLLSRIFLPESATQFRWERWTRLRGRLAHVFSYRIQREHSKYTLNFKILFKHYKMTSGMRGLVYVDRETSQVMRFTAEADGLPDNWPIRRTPSVLDYDYADVGGQRFLLPQLVDSRVIMREGQNRNVIEFGDYRKFSSEATVTFGK